MFTPTIINSSSSFNDKYDKDIGNVHDFVLNSKQNNIRCMWILKKVTIKEKRIMQNLQLDGAWYGPIVTSFWLLKYLIYKHVSKCYILWETWSL